MLLKLDARNTSVKPIKIGHNHSYPVHMSKLSGPKSMGFLHHNQNFDVISETSDYDPKNLIVMQKTCGLLAS